MLLWPVNARGKFLTLAEADVKWQLQWETVLNVSDWQVVETQVISPLHYHLETATKKMLPELQGIILVQQTAVSGLLEHIAQRGFSGLPVRLVKRIRKAWVEQRESTVSFNLKPPIGAIL